MSAMQGPIRSGYKNPSPGLCSAKALRKHIVDFKSFFIQPDCVLKLIGFLSMEKYIPGKTLNYITLTVQQPMRDRPFLDAKREGGKLNQRST